MTYRLVILCCFIWAGMDLCIAQSENQLVKSSSSFFEKKKYAQAIDGYRQLLSNDLKNIDYNYCYAVCLFHTKNPKSSEKYFNYLLEQSNCPPEVYFFKGRLYHINYQFDNAIDMYANYISLKTKKSQYLGASEEIKRCQHAKELLKSPRAIQVLRQAQKNAEDYFSAYLFDSINYKLYSQQDFGKKYNLKKNFTPKYVFKRGMKYRFFSSYSNVVESGKDIFYQKKNQNNNWDPPQRLYTDVNTSLDEDFPFYDERTGYLYFSSTGHNSMGGYDLFRAKFSRKTLKAEEVENLNFPYSSTANDFLFIPNLPSENVIFSTDRNQDIGGISVVEARFNAPVLSSLVASLYFKDNIDTENTSAVFYITNGLSKEKFGPFKTNDIGTLYFIVPAPGEYLIEAKIDGSDHIFEDTIDIPPRVEGFEFEVNASYKMIDSREAIIYNQNLIQTSDMVVDIESIELNEFEKLVVNTKTIDATMEMELVKESMPMDDNEIQARINDYIDLEVELEDQIRQKIKLIENINELYSKNDEVDKKIDLIVLQNNKLTTSDVDSLNPILYDLLIDRKIVVSALIGQKAYNAGMIDLDTLQQMYAKVTEFNKTADALLVSGNKDSLSRMLRSETITPKGFLDMSSLATKVRKELAEMESRQEEIQALIDAKSSELKELNSQKAELVIEQKAVSNIEDWDALSDSIDLLESRIYILDKDKRVLDEKYEVLEGQLIYAREGLLNITLIDADGNDLENELQALNNEINVDKYASAELYARDRKEASQSLKTLKSNQNEERRRVRNSGLERSAQDTIILASEYEHIQALNQFGDQEDLVAENRVNKMIQDSESIINALSKANRSADVDEQNQIIATNREADTSQTLISTVSSMEIQGKNNQKTINEKVPELYDFDSNTEESVAELKLVESPKNDENRMVNKDINAQSSVRQKNVPDNYTDGKALQTTQETLANLNSDKNQLKPNEGKKRPDSLNGGSIPEYNGQQLDPKSSPNQDKLIKNTTAKDNGTQSNSVEFTETLDSTISQNIVKGSEQQKSRLSDEVVIVDESISKIQPLDAGAKDISSDSPRVSNKNNEPVEKNKNQEQGVTTFTKDDEKDITSISEPLASDERNATVDENKSQDQDVSTFIQKDEGDLTIQAANQEIEDDRASLKSLKERERNTDDSSSELTQQVTPSKNNSSEDKESTLQELNKKEALRNGLDMDLADTESAVSNESVLKGQPTLETQSGQEISASAKASEIVNSMDKDNQEIENELASNKETQATEVTEDSGKTMNSAAQSNEIIESSRDQISNEEITEASIEEKIKSSEVNKRQKGETIDNITELVVNDGALELVQELPDSNQKEKEFTNTASAEQVSASEEISTQKVNENNAIELVSDTDENTSLIAEKVNDTNDSKIKVVAQEMDDVSSQDSRMNEKNDSNDLQQNTDISTSSIDENVKPINPEDFSESISARIESLRFDANEEQGPEFGESVKLLTALVLDAELDINEVNSEAEPKRKKDKVLLESKRKEQEARLAYFQNELNLELTNQNIENKYLRLKSTLPGVQFETIDNLNAQLLEIQIKEQDLIERLSRTKAQNEISMLKKLIEANRSRKLMIEEELLQMQSFERNELQVTIKEVNEKKIASILASESYLSYVERRQKLQEANDLLNELKEQNRAQMMALDVSLRLTTNEKSLTEEQKQMVKEIRQLQQAILYLEEEVRLRNSNLELENTSAEYEYLYQNEVNPSITSNESIVVTSLKDLIEVQVNNKGKAYKNDALASSKARTSATIESQGDAINQSQISDISKNSMPNVSDTSTDFSNDKARIIFSEEMSSETQLTNTLLQIKDPLSVLESKNYKSYVQDRILANRLVKEIENVQNISSSVNSPSIAQIKSRISREAEDELALKSAIDLQISRKRSTNQNISLTDEDLETTFSYVNESKLTLIRKKLDKVIKSIAAYDSSMVYEALLRNEFTEPKSEGTASLEKSLNSLDLVDYGENELIQSDFTVLKQEVISKNKDAFEIGNSNPSGLNFRVQVVAFRRPVRQDVYREFTPVSGQKLANGLIVYMAGYFNSSSSAVEAQKQIRSFGYSDAFIVAYCNDERLAFWKGKEYERNGTCIADTKNRFIALNNSENSNRGNLKAQNNSVESSELRKENASLSTNNGSAVIKTENPQSSFESPRTSQEIVDKESSTDVLSRNTSSYNNLSKIQAGRSVGGINVSGLFYSVQVGAFNRKIRGSELSKIRELDFYESNGLFRYSSGKFLTIDEARLRKTEVVNNGISDAFLVVFYNGKRITMQEARDLLKANGSSVLYRKKDQKNSNTVSKNSLANEKINQTNGKIKPLSEDELISPPKPITSELKSALKRPAESRTIKIIDKASAPRDEMIIYNLQTDSLDKNSIERLNRVGVFHYNKDSSKIISQAFKTSSINSMLSFYTNGMGIDNFVPGRFVIHTIKMNSMIDGALGDWLLRSKRTIGFTRLNKDIYLNFYLSSEKEKDLLMSELEKVRNN